MNKAQAIEILETNLSEAREDKKTATDDTEQAFYHGRIKALEETLYLVQSIGNQQLNDPKLFINYKNPKPPKKSEREPMTFKVNGKPLQKLTVDECRPMSTMWLSMDTADKRIKQELGTTRKAVQNNEIKAYEIGDLHMAYVRVEDFDKWAKNAGYMIHEQY